MSRQPVEEWLARLNLQKLTLADLDDGQSSSEKTEVPSTPDRRILVPETLDEASPTSTSFSHNTVFDKPHINHTGSNVDEDAFSDISATSVGEGKNDWDHCIEEQAEEKDIVTPEEAIDKYSGASLNSHSRVTSSPSNSLDIPADVNTYSNISASPPIDPNKPRLVWITSCLQCVYAGLPCSRTLPACSRCTRKCKADMCLLQRRKLYEERVRDKGVENLMPVLLKLNGEHEETWKRKEELGNELHQPWREKEEKKNWVMPMSGKKGDYWTYGNGLRASKLHPGEGVGRLTFRELDLA